MGDDDVEREERTIYLIVIIVQAPVVFVAIAGCADISGGMTLCLIGATLAGIGFLASIIRTLRRPRLPRARVRASRSRWGS